MVLTRTASDRAFVAGPIAPAGTLSERTSGQIRPMSWRCARAMKSRTSRASSVGRNKDQPIDAGIPVTLGGIRVHLTDGGDAGFQPPEFGSARARLHVAERRELATILWLVLATSGMGSGLIRISPRCGVIHPM